MQKKVFNCPNCGTAIEVSNPESKPVVGVVCTGCGLRMGVNFDTNKTVIAESLTDKKVIGCLVCGGERYELKLGVNTIGRKNPKSAATVQIATDDKSASRVHAEIEVVRLDNGSVKAILRDVRDVEKTNLKPMFLGEVRMYPEDRLNLENGDTFKIGETVIKYLQ